ncbi:MAG TPA: hypothetical protein VHN38_05955, partial [Immundisolibacter sp.]|nr:hypothetical protein [Immundisolibacter sp.]
ADAIDGWHLASLGGPRGSTAEQLAARLRAAGVSQAIACHADVPAACRAAQGAAVAGGIGRVLVFGSFVTVEQALRSGLLPAAGDGAAL